MVSFKAVVLFIRILTCFISHKTFGNIIYDIVEKYSELSTPKLGKLENLPIKLKKAISLFLLDWEVLMLYRNFWRLIYQIQMTVTQDLTRNGYYGVL